MTAEHKLLRRLLSKNEHFISAEDFAQMRDALRSLEEQLQSAQAEVQRWREGYAPELEELESLREQLEAAHALLAEIEEQAPPTPEEWHRLLDAAQAVVDVESYISIDGRTVLADEALAERVAALRAVLYPASRSDG